MHVNADWMIPLGQRESMIREILESELPDLLRLYEHLHASDDPLPPEDVVEEIWRKIQQNPDLKYFGAFVDDALVSACTLSVIPNLTRGCRPYGVVENVVFAFTAQKEIRHGNYRFSPDHADKRCFGFSFQHGRRFVDQQVRNDESKIG